MPLTNQPTPNQFITAPNRTLLAFAIPALLSLVVEPLTGLVDTAYVARLGSVPLAALGVGTTALSSTFWVFNFLGIGTQTEVAQAMGRQKLADARQMNGLALLLAGGLGVLLAVGGYPLLGPLGRLLGAEAEVLTTAVSYMQIRLFGAPAVLIILAGMGTLRGLQDMRTPFYIAFVVNGANLLLDWVLIFGVGPFPQMGIEGAALASMLSQWIGAGMAVYILWRRLGFPRHIPWADVRKLLQIGRDLFVRTGSLFVFMLIGTRVATLAGAESGAAHQAIRQFWLFATLAMDAFAIAGQSLIGFFVGEQNIAQARRVARLGAFWSVGTGLLLTLFMWSSTQWVASWLVPETAVAAFITPWLVAATFQPLNALAFMTDGVHMGTADYRYLRNGMMLATLVASGWLLLIDPSATSALVQIWLATAVWISVRTVWGMVRIWPGIGHAPLTLHG